MELKAKLIVFESLHPENRMGVRMRSVHYACAPLALQIKKKKKKPRHLQLRVRPKTRSNN